MDALMWWWFKNVVWPFAAWSGLDDHQAQSVLCGGPALWFVLLLVGLLWWRQVRRHARRFRATR